MTFFQICTSQRPTFERYVRLKAFLAVEAD